MAEWHGEHTQRRLSGKGSMSPPFRKACHGVSPGLRRGVGSDPIHRSFNVARLTSASTTEMIQKRTTTVDSRQPFSSK